MKRELDFNLYNQLYSQLYTFSRNGEEEEFGKTVYNIRPEKIENAEISIKGSDIEKYIQAFIEDGFMVEQDKEYYNYITHLLVALPIVNTKYQTIGNSFDLKDIEVTQDKKFLFLHFISALNLVGFIRIFDIAAGSLALHGFNMKVSLEVNSSFSRFYKKYKSQIEEYKNNNGAIALSLKDYQVSFDDKTHTVFVGEYKCVLPAFKNEHDLCRVMFRNKNGKSVDWSIIYKAMTSVDPIDNAQTKGIEQRTRMVKDTVYAVNERLQRELPTNDELFSWGMKTVKRNF